MMVCKRKLKKYFRRWVGSLEKINIIHYKIIRYEDSICDERIKIYYYLADGLSDNDELNYGAIMLPSYYSKKCIK